MIHPTVDMFIVIESDAHSDDISAEVFSAGTAEEDARRYLEALENKAYCVRVRVDLEPWT